MHRREGYLLFGYYHGRFSECSKSISGSLIALFALHLYGMEKPLFCILLVYFFLFYIELH